MNKQELKQVIDEFSDWWNAEYYCDVKIGEDDVLEYLDQLPSEEVEKVCKDYEFGDSNCSSCDMDKICYKTLNKTI